MSRPSARVRARAIRSCTSCRRKKPLPACVETPDSLVLQSLFSNRQSSSSNWGQQWDIAQSARPHLPLSTPDESIANKTPAQIGYAFRFGVTDRVGPSVVFVGDRNVT